MRFYSDNTATACPEILAALTEASQGLAVAYGDDPWTQRLDAVLGGFFGAEVRAFAVATGTAANALSLATLSPPYGAIYAHEEAHIAADECGAPGFFSGGAQLVPLPGAAGKLTLEALQLALDAHPAFCKRAHRPGQKTMLPFADPRVQRGRVILVAHIDGVLKQDGTAVEIIRDEVDGTAGDFHAMFERAGDGVHAAAERWQE